LLGACGTPTTYVARTFDVEPNNRLTVGAQLEAGDVLQVRAERLDAGARLRLHRCGPGCATTDLVAEWEARHFAGGAEAAQRVVEPGEYYFWLEDTTLPSKQSAIQVGALEATADGVAIAFGAHTRVIVRVGRG
ncbi:MAG TPA: hypothetical protein VFL14_16740, partial [Xanthomonadales bacterium]|nr:hypothetical protein [Xanthomonadales bacterium]